MTSKTTPAAMFEKVLRAYESHGISFADVRGHLRRLLAVGGAPLELSAVLGRRAWAEKLPEYARLQELLDAAIEQTAAESENHEPAEFEAPAQSATSTVVAMPNPSLRMPVFEPEPRSEEVTVDLDFDALNKESKPTEPLRASELDLSVLAGRLHSIDERSPARHAAIESLTRSYERSKEAEAAAAERATALAADLEAAQTAFQAQKNKALELDQALAESIASARAEHGLALRETQRLEAELRTARAELEAVRSELQASQEAGRQQALRESQRHQAEMRKVLDSLGERDARISALGAERASLENSVEARAKVEARLEADLRAARTQAEAVKAELQANLRASQEAARALDAQLKRGGSRLDATRKELDATREKSGAYLELLRTRAWRQGFDQNQFLESDARSDAEGPSRGAPPPVDRDESRPEPAAPVAPPPAPARERSPTVRRASWSKARAVRVVAWGAAISLLLGIAWRLSHRLPAQIPVAAIPEPGSVIHDCPTCPAMTVLPEGRFKQGAADGSALEQPLHSVTIGRSIAMSTSPVTLEDFEPFISATGRDMQGCDTYDGEWRHQPDNSWEQPGFAQTGKHPVTCVSWDDARAYAKWLTTKTGHRYRLPSASEWEYAARAGGEAVLPWNPDGQGACANANVADASAAGRYPGWTVFPCDDGYVYTAPVGAFKANPFGLKDMLGNVLQWTEDCWHANYDGAPADGSAWSDGDCSQHELRGGSWFSKPTYVRADYRNHFPADYRTSSAGFRLVRDIQP